RLTAENYSRYIEFVNYEEAFAGETGRVVACFHYSNFEWLSIASGFRGVEASVSAQEFKNPLLNPVFREWRELSGHTIVASGKGGVVRLRRALQQKRTVAILVDLTVPPERRAVVIDCLGLKTCVTSAHAWLHELIDAPIIPAHCEPLPGG